VTQYILDAEEYKVYQSFLTKITGYNLLKTDRSLILCGNDASEIIIELKASFFETTSAIPNYLILLMEAGAASLGFFEEGELESHKMIRKYMVRQKQGKVQLNHLKTKGKSKLGSRIRIQQSKQFFEEINEKLTEWEVDERTDYIFYNATQLLWNEVFNAKTEPFFKKDDPRLQKINFQTYHAGFEELLRINDVLKNQEITIHHELLWEDIKKDYNFVE
jgi:Bacteroidetes VLRF1 release factor